MFDIPKVFPKEFFLKSYFEKSADDNKSIFKKLPSIQKLKQVSRDSHSFSYTQ